MYGLSQGLVVVKGGENDGEDLRVGGTQSVHDVDAGTIGQLQIHQDHVRTHQVGAAHSVSNGAGLGDNLEGVVAVDDLGNATSNDLVVVNDHDARTRGRIFTHVLILTVGRANALVYLLLLGRQAAHRILRGRVLRVLLRRGLSRADRIGAL